MYCKYYRAASFLLLCFLFLPEVKTQTFILEKLPPLINSSYDEITPVPSRDGNSLYFTRVAYPDFNHYLFLDSVDLFRKMKPEKYQRLLANIYSEISNSSISDPERSSFNQDVWIAEGDSAAQFTRIQHPHEPLNNALPNSIVTITPDPNAFYCINQFKPAGDMNKGFSIIRRSNDSTWLFPEPVDIQEYYTITSDVSLTMSFDGQVLILAATRYDSRDMDLYVCFKDGDNKWSAPRNLGPVINSEKREITPFLSEDNITLFFASNQWSTSGGMDIFMTKRLDNSWQNWERPTRLVEPINSRSDESQPYFNMTSGYLYFASKRDGNSDIFRVQIAPPQPTELVIKGRIINRRTRELVRDAEVLYGAKYNPRNQFHSTDGEFTLRVPKGVVFEMIAEKPAFSGSIEEVFFRRDYYFFKEAYYVDLFLDPLEAGAKIELRPIFFQQSKSTILEKSFPELDRLANTLRDNPGLQIRIEGHTDNVGKAEDLLQLSQDRADAVRTFLIEKGIQSGRISTLGLGPKFPLNDNSTEDLRQFNRRVEIIITKT